MSNPRAEPATKWARWLDRAMTRAGLLTLDDAASALRVTMNTVACWRRGDRAPRPKEQARVERILARRIERRKA